MQRIAIKTYIFTFIITLLVFVIAFFISHYINQKKTDTLKSIEDKIAVDTISFETKFGTVKQSSCSAFNNDELSQQLSDLSAGLSYMEGQLGTNDPELFRLKRYYALLEIKDYLLVSNVVTKCNLRIPTILYFYDQNCNDCVKEDYVLQALHDNDPEVSIYSFDYNKDLSTVETLISLTSIPTTTPSLILSGNSYTEFTSLDTLQQAIQSLEKIKPVKKN